MDFEFGLKTRRHHAIVSGRREERRVRRINRNCVSRPHGFRGDLEPHQRRRVLRRQHPARLTAHGRARSGGSQTETVPSAEPERPTNQAVRKRRSARLVAGGSAEPAELTARAQEKPGSDQGKASGGENRRTCRGTPGSGSLNRPGNTGIDEIRNQPATENPRACGGFLRSGEWPRRRCGAPS